MELFTLGLGNYTDHDVKEAARAFTGYSSTREGEFTFIPAQHDDGDKTILGVTQNFDADDVLAMLVRHPATARRLSGKLYRWFVDDNPGPATLDRLAATYTASGFDMRAVVRDIFTGPEFLAPQAFHAHLKQPVELVIGTLKALEVQNVGPDIAQSTRRMGQDLLNPPDVSGWKGGSSWINSSTLFERFNFANKLATGRDPAKPYFTDVLGQLSAAGVSSADGMVDYYLNLLVDGDVTPEARQTLIEYVNSAGGFSLDPSAVDSKGRGLLHLALSVPTSQLA
jgi:uncharacterized protein (DUF1800 family)